MVDAKTLERIVPDELVDDGATGVATLDLHLARYRFAARHMIPGSLLDIACGVGYGTNILVSACPQLRRAVGVDLSASALEYASTRYAQPTVRWIQGDAMEFEDSEGFDNIVSIETVEHLPDPQRFFRKLAGMLRPAGMLLASVPTTPSMDGNPHHLNDFTEASYRRLADGLPLKEMAHFRQVQPFSAARVVSGKEARLTRTREDLVRFYARHPGKIVNRVASTLRYGFVNRYVTIAWQRAS